MIKKVYTEEPVEDITSENINVIPGIKENSAREYRYVFDGTKNKFFTKREGGLLLELKKVPLAELSCVPESGRLYEERYKIFLPTGEIFVAFSYDGDINAWKCLVEETSTKLGLPFAKLDKNTNKVILSDNRIYDLFECKFCSFYYDLVTSSSKK